jgi:hypothetical protein
MSIAHEGNQHKLSKSFPPIKPLAEGQTVTHLSHEAYERLKAEGKIVEPQASITYASGYRRSDDVPAFDLIEPAFLLAMAEVMSEGEKKHGRENWKLATLDEQWITVRHLQGHLNKWLSGDRSEPHLAKVAIGAMFLYYHECKSK